MAQMARTLELREHLEGMISRSDAGPKRLRRFALMYDHPLLGNYFGYRSI